MSVSLNSITLRESKKEFLSLRNKIDKNGRAVLKCSENILKPRCNKALKRKLKKYKLRKDGKEDPEIIDVSLSFIKSLTIKSPNQTIVGGDKEPSIVKHSFTMGRKERKNVGTEVAEVNDITSQEVISCQDTQGNNQTDAFKLLMDSRNKVIGGNSPGKEYIVETYHDQEIIEKKEIKAKRILSLQKMATAKSASEKLLQEESREIYINKKMEQRAERLKNMIMKSDMKLKKKVINEFSAGKSNEIKESTLEAGKISDNKNMIFRQTLPSILPDEFVPKKTMNKPVSEEEAEFLKKLSPSIRKKENMLCYFNVITKDAECISNNSENYIHGSNSETILKVKFTHKKKKGTVNHEKIHTPLVVTNSSDCESIEKIASTSDDVVKLEFSNRQKRKRKTEITESKPIKCVNEIPDRTRPKKSNKKSVKLIENTLSSTSDEELQIFTPKKKKSLERKLETIKSNQIKTTKSRTDKKTEKQLNKYKNKESPKINEKVPQKLAPIFITKPQLTSAELKAKQKFLHSGIPKHIKKNTSTQTNNRFYNEFPKVTHIQQIPLNYKEMGFSSLSVTNNDDEIEVTNLIELGLIRNLLNLNITQSNFTLDLNYNAETLLKTMKQMYTKFPVYRTYHSLKAKSKGECGESQYSNLDNSMEIMNGILDIWHDHPDKLKWTDKYKAISTKQIIGNFDSIKELRKWLITWTENVEITKDYSDSDFCYSDTDSGEVIKMRNNLLILSGKSGTGKTSSVYAVASELSMKVIEVNASSKRTGKIMLQDLQEATQSHKVDRQMDSENSQKSSERDITVLTKAKKHAKSAKSKEKVSQKSLLSKKNNTEPFSSQESVKTVMSLILIDDADIVFEQDDGFCSAVAQLVHSSKRPVILVTESLQCPHLQKFLKYGHVIKLQPFLPRMLGTWLDIMCLADAGMCYPGLGAKLLDFFQGDIRKCTNHLQYYITSQKHICKHENVFERPEFLTNKLDVNDESSGASWAANDEFEEKTSISNDFLNSIINFYMSKQLNMNNPSVSLKFNVWWSLPELLDFGINEKRMSSPEERVSSNDKILELEAISSALEDFSVLDMYQHNAELHSNITSRPWLSTENASLAESENFEYYDSNNEIKQNISCSLMQGRIKLAQKILKCEHKSYLHFPSMAMQRERDKIVDRHKNLAIYLNPSVILDRKAVSLDYWPACRDMCRMEKTKTGSNVKRNNRFCHYLKSLNILFKNDDFDKLGDSLCLDKKV